MVDLPAQLDPARLVVLACQDESISDDACQQGPPKEFLAGMRHCHTWITEVTDATDATDATAKTKRRSCVAVTRASKELLFLKLRVRKKSSLLARITATSAASHSAQYRSEPSRIGNVAAACHVALACAVRKDTRKQSPGQALHQRQPLDLDHSRCFVATVRTLYQTSIRRTAKVTALVLVICIQSIRKQFRILLPCPHEEQLQSIQRQGRINIQGTMV